MAFSPLKNLESSLSKKPEVASAYGKIIKDYLTKGYVKKIPSSNDEHWLLPLFAIMNNQKTSTKVCVVFNPAAKHNGKSLNEAIYPGPKLQRELINVLTCFRRAPVAISVDISEMFLQVGLVKEDHPYHRFLWRDLDQTKPPDVYEFQRLPFGNTASPFCKQQVLHSHAEANKAAFPKAADTFENAMYVDDVLDSCETVNDATDLRKETFALVSGAGFTLKKRVPTMKTLGVLWQADCDTFSFQIQLQPLSELPTKQNVLHAMGGKFFFLGPWT